MWCPKCNIEYQKGVTVCADCGTELIEHDGEIGVDICEISDEAVADEIVEFLLYSKVEDVKKEPKDDASGFQIRVPEKAVKKAERLIKGYLLAKEEEKAEAVEKTSETETVETDDSLNTPLEEEADSPEEHLFSEEIEDTEELLYTAGKKEYVRMKDKYRDIKFSGITFIIFGILGAIYLLLTKFEIIPISYNIFVFCVLSVLFAAFIISGIISCIKSLKYKRLIPEEEAKALEINNWLEENLTKEMIEKWSDSNASAGENDLLITAHIRTLLAKEFPAEPVGFLEILADEYYEEHFFED